MMMKKKKNKNEVNKLADDEVRMSFFACNFVVVVILNDSSKLCMWNFFLSLRTISIEM